VIDFNPDNCSLILEALYNISKDNTNNKVYSNAIENSTNLDSENASDCIVI
jgi:hypothetical protein